MKMLILGDCHGRHDLVRDACHAAEVSYGVQAAIQVGDFGFFRKPIDMLVSGKTEPFPIPVHVIDGNHEDHRFLVDAQRSGKCDAWHACNLIYHARGTTSSIGGVTFGFLGGALHADRRQQWSGMWQAPTNVPKFSRIPPNPEWANWVTEGDLLRALTTFAQAAPDVLVSHSCPAGIGVGMAGDAHLLEDADRFIRRAGFFGGPINDCGESSLTLLWRQLAQRPAHWIFGHFHVIHERAIDQTRFTCVGSTDDSDGLVGIRPVIFDTSDRSLVINPALRL